MSEYLKPYFPFLENDHLNSVVVYINGISGLALASLIILASAVSAGLIITLNALRFEFGKNMRTIYLFIAVILEFSLFVMFAPNKNDAVLGFTVMYVIHTIACLFYGLWRSKSIYDSMKKSGAASHSHNVLFWSSVFFIIAGEALTLAFLNITRSSKYMSEIIGGVGQICVFLGLCCWIHFLNILERTGASPKVVKRMFWGALGVILLAIITLIILALIFFVIFNELKVNIAESVNGITIDRSSSNTIYYSSITSMIVLVILIFGNHLSYVSMFGYTIWDLCASKNSEWDKSYDVFANRKTNGLSLTAL
jgi:hypothetical protein